MFVDKVGADRVHLMQGFELAVRVPPAIGQLLKFIQLLLIKVIGTALRIHDSTLWLIFLDQASALLARSRSFKVCRWPESISARPATQLWLTVRLRLL